MPTNSYLDETYEQIATECLAFVAGRDDCSTAQAAARLQSLPLSQLLTLREEARAAAAARIETEVAALRGAADHVAARAHQQADALEAHAQQVAAGTLPAHAPPSAGEPADDDPADDEESTSDELAPLEPGEDDVPATDSAAEGAADAAPQPPARKRAPRKKKGA